MSALRTAVCAAAVAACAAGAASPATAPFRVTLQRGPCFGACPMYSVTVRGNGSVTFVGTRYTTVRGVQRARLSRAKVAALRRAVAQARVFSLRDQYADVTIADLPSATTTVVLGPRKKRVYHLFGDPGAPLRLRRLECAIDRIVATKRWVGRPVPECPVT